MHIRSSSSLAIQHGLELRLGTAKPAADDELRFNCPKCRHSDYRLYVNISKGVYICHECSWRGTVSYLCRFFDIDIENDVPGVSDLRERLLFGRRDEPPSPGPLRFPDAVPALVNTLVREYLAGRGLTERQIIDSGVFLRTKDMYQRVYFPEFDSDGEIRYCVSRRYIEGDTWPKYMSVGSNKQRGVYRLSSCCPGSEITLVEGPFDALVQWENTAALYGTFLNDRQVKLLMRKSNRFVVALDADAASHAAEVGAALMRRGALVRMAILPVGEDPASLGREGFDPLRGSARPMSETELIRLKFS